MENKITAPLLETKDLKKYFYFRRRFFGPKKAMKAVDGIDLAIYSGETFGFVGESGCRKIHFRPHDFKADRAHWRPACFIESGKPIEGRSREELRLLKRKCKLYSRTPACPADPRMTVLDLVKAPLDVFKIGTERAHGQVVSTLEYVGLGSQHLNRYPHEFSGGQRQRHRHCPRF